ncbi:phosphoethanolamine transferase [Acidovorax sp. SUPP3334]|uniref:phosphoethanolamine transferase n=1 Tax=Acidovorax sp. SUPP3334 TaxID=2920881 RepID=UPI0023DE4F9E|nr:phosphoethanolamine transferase [Acidovorax sp. SUPP3334]GKT23297.1 phosphoethanolamine transferase [Acidovorax sp. SUPP3334]
MSVPPTVPDPSSLPAAPPPTPRQALYALGLATATVLALVVLGHDGRRVAQLMALALPALLWLAWPVRSDAVHRLRTAAVWLWAMAFALDGAARAYLLNAYQAAPDSALVLSAAANTTGRESAEYLSMHWRSVAVWCGALACAGLLVGRSARRGLRTSARWPRWSIALLCGLLLLSALGYASKPWRRLHPVAYWLHWNASVNGLRSGWSDLEKQRSAALERARVAAPALTRTGPSTVVLVVTDSINRDNMGLYGYARPTTPRLQAQQQLLGTEMAVLRNAWSVDASTLPAMGNLFGFGQPGRADGQHLIALARAAGYKTWWMSNHDDVAIEQQHARMADVVDMVNRTPGRSGASLDGELLDCVQEALEDPAERKLIVVHLMGAHPHYRLRFPSGDNPFEDHADAVDAQLTGQGRSAWVRRYRQQYDAALLYNDFVVAETLQLARNAGRTDGYRAWMYLSDHGQEVGHGSDRAGHSPSTASGYRIPALIWRNEAAQPVSAAMQLRPFRADWAAWTLADLLHIDWAGALPERNVLDDRYRWVAPTLPVAVPSFFD